MTAVVGIDQGQATRDEHFDAHKELIDPQRQPTFHALIQMTWNQGWDRTPEQLLQSEEAIYREEFEFILDDLLAHDRSLPLIAEGTALMPDLVAPLLADVAAMVAAEKEREGAA